MLTDDKGIQVVFNSHNCEIFKHEWFDDINGDTDITSNQKLYDAFDAIID